MEKNGSGTKQNSHSKQCCKDHGKPRMRCFVAQSGSKLGHKEVGELGGEGGELFLYEASYFLTWIYLYYGFSKDKDRQTDMC